MLLCVNYHYVDPPAGPYPGIHGLSREHFREHIGWLARYFEPIGIQALQAALRGAMALPSQACLITFDDALRCHGEIVADILHHDRIPATFFACSGPLVDKKATAVHKSQFVRAHTSPEELLTQLSLALERDGEFLDWASIEVNEIREHYRYDPIEIARLKYVLNYRCSETLRTEVLDTLFSSLVDDEVEFCRQWYLTGQELRKLDGDLVSIASHSHSHLPLATLDDSAVLFELAKSKEVLETTLGREVYATSYPLGNSNAVGHREGALAQSVGYEIGFTMERSLNMTLNEPMFLARFDCNDLPGVGKSPLFSMFGNTPQGMGGSTLARQRYFDESASR